MPGSKPPSMSNTKQEILEAYKQLQLQFKEKESAELKPDKQLKEKKEAQVVKVADTVSAEGAMKEINNLKLEVNKILSQLSEKLEDATGQYEKIKEAIIVKETDLKEVFEIEKEAHSLAALIEAQNQRKMSFETEMEEKRQSLSAEIDQTRRDWEEEKKEHQAFIKERDAEEKKRREREADEYTYSKNRENKLTSDEYKDKQARLEKELTEMRETAEKEMADKKKELQEREAEIVEREKTMNELQSRIDTFSAEIDKATQKTVKDTTDTLTADFTSQINFLKKEAEGEKRVQESRIESLEKTIEDQKTRIEKLTKQLDESYQKVQDIAVKAIEGTKDSKVISQLEKLFQESGPKQSGESRT